MRNPGIDLFQIWHVKAALIVGRKFDWLWRVNFAFVCNLVVLVVGVTLTFERRLRQIGRIFTPDTRSILAARCQIWVTIRNLTSAAVVSTLAYAITTSAALPLVAKLRYAQFTIFIYHIRVFLFRNRSLTQGGASEKAQVVDSGYVAVCGAVISFSVGQDSCRRTYRSYSSSST